MKAKPYLKSVTIKKPPGELRFPFTIPSIAAINTLEFHEDVTFLVGENGSGKSTLLEAIASVMDFGAQGGTGNFSIGDNYGHSDLDRFMHAKRSYQRPKDRYFLRAESFFNLGTYLEDLARDPDANTTRGIVFQRYGGKSPHEESHGESFMRVLTYAFGGKGLYILDEPEAALSPSRQMAALVRIDDLVKQNSQFIVATHSPILMAYPRARIYLLNETGVQEIAYTDTEHYRVTKDFLNSFPKRLSQLFSPEDSLET